MVTVTLPAATSGEVIASRAETVDFNVSVCPYTGDEGVTCSTVLVAGAVAGPVNVNCTEAGVD
jgi:hypothetical protein